MAEKIQYGQYITYEGKVDANKNPNGKGKLELAYKVQGSAELVTKKDVMEGVFSDGKVTNAKLLLARYNTSSWITFAKFQGTLEFSIDSDGNSITYTLLDGKFETKDQHTFIINNSIPLIITRTPSPQGCETETGEIYDANFATPTSADDVIKVYLHPFELSKLGEIKNVWRYKTYILNKDFSVRENPSLRYSVELGNGGILSNTKEGVCVTFPNKDFFIICKGAQEYNFKKTLSDGVLSYKEGDYYLLTGNDGGRKGYLTKTQEELQKVFQSIMNATTSQGIDGIRYEGPVAELLENALSGNAQAQYDLAMALIEGKGVDKDERKGRAWLNLAAENGNQSAFAILTAENVTPENCGFTLVRTSTIDGFRCDHYEKGEEKVRTFRKDNGDFITYEEDIAGMDRTPYGSPWGTWRATNNRGIVFSNHKIIYPTGVTVFTKEAQKYGDWYYFKNYGKGETDTFNGADLERYRDRKKGDFVCSPDNPGKWYPYVVEKAAKYSAYSGFRIGDIIYRTTNMGNLVPCVKKMKVIWKGKEELPEELTYVYHVLNSTDTITEAEMIEYDPEEFQSNSNYFPSFKYTYKNGDVIIIGNNTMTGTIHRNGGIMQILNADRIILKWPDGKVYDGKIAWQDVEGSYREFNLLPDALMSDEVILWEGTMQLPDRTLVNYKGGRTEADIKAEEEARRRANAQEEKEVYNKACKRWGKQYVDAAFYQQKPIVGMPEELLLAAFKTELIRVSGSSKQYRVKMMGLSGSSSITLGYVTKYTVWVNGGRVTSIRYWK